MKQETKAKVLSKVNRLYTKAVTVGAAAASGICTAAMSVSASDGPAGGGSSGSTGFSTGLSTALASVDPNVVLDGFYQVLPTVLTIALPIIGAKVALNFLFGSVKGA